jgi:hypothetical protein
MGILDNAKQVAKAVERDSQPRTLPAGVGPHSDIIELVEENNHLRGEIAELKRQDEIKGKLRVVDDPSHVYYFRRFLPQYGELRHTGVGAFSSIKL